MKKIVFADTDGRCVVTTPAQDFLDDLQRKHPDWTEEQLVKYVADKDLPSGTKYSVMTDEEIADLVGTNEDGTIDRTFRDAWEYTAPADAAVSEDLSAEDLAKHNMTEQTVW